VPGSTTLIHDALRPVLVGTAFEGYHDGRPDDDGGAQAGVVWCAATRDFVRRHPSATAPVDVEHPDGCIDLWVHVDDAGLLETAFMECLDLDDGLVGRPVEEVLPELARRIADVLR